MDDNRDDCQAASPETPSRYGDALVRAGDAFWALWSPEGGDTRLSRFRSWAEADDARAGTYDNLPCLRYTWGGA